MTISDYMTLQSLIQVNLWPLDSAGWWWPSLTGPLGRYLLRLIFKKKTKPTDDTKSWCIMQAALYDSFVKRVSPHRPYWFEKQILDCSRHLKVFKCYPQNNINLVRKIVWYILASQPLGWNNSSDQAIGVGIYEIYVFLYYLLY